MEFDNSFTVEKPIDEVWSTMVDLERVVPCVPGATILEKTGDKAVKAEVKIKLGSMSMNYSGPAEIVEQDDTAHRAVMNARGEGGRRPGQRGRKGLHAADRVTGMGPRWLFTPRSTSRARPRRWGRA